MVAGSLWGKRYSRIQVVAVLLLTVGVITAAWSDAQSKARLLGHIYRTRNIANLCGQGNTTEAAAEPTSTFSNGLIILFIAQVLSAIMGLYTEETYKKYGGHWKENLFYSHLLSLPLFLPFSTSLYRQFMRLLNSPPLTLPAYAEQMALSSTLPDTVRDNLKLVYIPSQLVFLALNVLTQYACIRGVNLLAAAASALTVTIVLNIRKLISLLLSIWLFGNRLASGTLVGAVVVFSAGALYSLDSGGRKQAPRHKSPAISKAG